MGFVHVAVVKNINNVVVNKPANPHKIRIKRILKYNFQIEYKTYLKNRKL